VETRRRQQTREHGRAARERRDPLLLEQIENRVGAVARHDHERATAIGRIVQAHRGCVGMEQRQHAQDPFAVRSRRHERLALAHVRRDGAMREVHALRASGRAARVLQHREIVRRRQRMRPARER
jgi:hypothetical protein